MTQGFAKKVEIETTITQGGEDKTNVANSTAEELLAMTVDRLDRILEHWEATTDEEF